MPLYPIILTSMAVLVKMGGVAANGRPVSPEAEG